MGAKTVKEVIIASCRGSDTCPLNMRLICKETKLSWNKVYAIVSQLVASGHINIWKDEHGFEYIHVIKEL